MKKVLFLIFSLFKIFPLFDLGHKVDEKTLNSFKELIDNNFLNLIKNMKIGLNDKTIDFLKDYRMKIDARTLSDLQRIFENVKVGIDDESLDKLGQILTQIKVEVDKETFKSVESLSNQSLSKIENLLKIIESISNKFLASGRNILIIFFVYQMFKKFFLKNFKDLRKINKK